METSRGMSGATILGSSYPSKRVKFCHENLILPASLHLSDRSMHVVPQSDEASLWASRHYCIGFSELKGGRQSTPSIQLLCKRPHSFSFLCSYWSCRYLHSFPDVAMKLTPSICLNTAVLLVHAWKYLCYTSIRASLFAVIEWDMQPNVTTMTRFNLYSMVVMVLMS